MLILILLIAASHNVMNNLGMTTENTDPALKTVTILIFTFVYSPSIRGNHLSEM